MKDKLLKAKELVEKGWTQHRNACSDEGATVAFYEQRAAHFCMVGAMLRAGMTTEEINSLGSRFSDLTNARYMTTWNDKASTTKEAVVEMLGRLAE